MSSVTHSDPTVRKAHYESRSRIWRMEAQRLRGQIRDYIAFDLDPDGEQVKVLTKWAEDAERLTEYYQRKAEEIT